MPDQTELHVKIPILFQEFLLAWTIGAATVLTFMTAAAITSDFGFKPISGIIADHTIAVASGATVLLSAISFLTRQVWRVVINTTNIANDIKRINGTVAKNVSSINELETQHREIRSYLEGRAGFFMKTGKSIPHSSEWANLYKDQPEVI